MTYGLHLLLLCGGKDCVELLSRLLLNGAHLLTAGIVGKGRIAPESRHFLLAIGEDRFDLGRLVWCQAELACKTCGLAAGIRGVVALNRSR